MPEGISPFDIALGLPLLWSAIRGVRKGLILEVTGLAALFLGAYAALFCSDLVRCGYVSAYDRRTKPKTTARFWLLIPTTAQTKQGAMPASTPDVDWFRLIRI